MNRRPSHRDSSSDTRCTIAIVGDPGLLEASRRELGDEGFSVYGYHSVEEFLQDESGADPLCWFVSPELAKEFCCFLERNRPTFSGPVLLISNQEQIEHAVCALRAGIVGRDRLILDREMEERVSSLTPREREVLEGVVNGLTNREIGERLHISVRTVESHRAHLMEKLRVRSVSALFHAALSYDLVHLPDLQGAVERRS